jgi:hypothetical protein
MTTSWHTGERSSYKKTARQAAAVVGFDRLQILCIDFCARGDTGYIEFLFEPRTL